MLYDCRLTQSKLSDVAGEEKKRFNAFLAQLISAYFIQLYSCKGVSGLESVLSQDI
jgi:hypothetical protein